MFKDLVVLIVGCSRGIGLDLGKFFLEKGSLVIGTYNNNLIDLDIDSFKCDLSKEEDIDNLFSYIKDKYKRIDILINCASTTNDMDIYELTKEDFMHVLEVNLVGTFLVCKNASLLMNKGVIINFSSTDGINTYQVMSMDYGASKAGVINLTKNLANRFPNLKICSLAPNWVGTESVLEMDKNYLEKEMKRVKQKNLISLESIREKIVEIIESDNIKSGDIVVMEDCNE